MADRTVNILGGRHGVSRRWLVKWTRVAMGLAMGLAMRLAVRLAVAMAVAMAAVAGALLRMRSMPMSRMSLGLSCLVCVLRDVAPGGSRPTL